jgi:ACS family tartrate transporter-like MFS transporter
MSAPRARRIEEGPPDATRLRRTTLTKVSRTLIPFMFLLYVANFIDRVNVSFAALGMSADLGLSGTAYGFGAGVFFIGYLLFQVPANLILVRVGARRWIGTLVIAWAVVAGSFAFIRTPVEFFTLRVLLGFAEAGFFPGMIMYLTLWFPSAERARAVARFMAAIPLSAVVGGPVAGVLLQLHGVGGIAGWRWLFMLEAVPSLLLGVAVFRLLPDGPADARWLEPDERAWLDDTLAREREAASSRIDVSPARTLANGTVWGLALLWLSIVLPYYGVALWLPQLLREHGTMSDLQLGVLAAVPPLAGCVAMMVIGSSSDARNERFAHVGLPQVLAIVGFVMAALSHTVVQTVVGLALATAGTNGVTGPFWSLPSRFLSGRAAASAIALINTVGSFGGFAGPYALGALKDRTRSFSVALLWLATLPVASMIATFLLARAPLLADEGPSEPDCAES